MIELLLFIIEVNDFFHYMHTAKKCMFAEDTAYENSYALGNQKKKLFYFADFRPISHFRSLAWEN